jgi:hypothetical protein
MGLVGLHGHSVIDVVIDVVIEGVKSCHTTEVICNRGNAQEGAFLYFLILLLVL